MKSTWNRNNEKEGILIIEIDGDVWKNACEYIWKQEADALELPHFKRVPVIVAKKHIDPHIIYEKAINETMHRVYAQALIRHHLYAIEEPIYSNMELSEEKAVVSIQLKVASKAKVGQYKGLSIQKKKIEITQEEIQEELLHIQRKNTYTMDKEGYVELNDQVVLDYTGMVDGELIEGGSASDFVLTVGSSTFMDDFENQLLGMKPKEEKKISVIFPLSYPDSKLAGKEVLFYVYVKEIQTKVIPSIDDTLAGDEGYETLEDLKEAIIENKTSEKEYYQKQEAMDEAIDIIIKNSEFDIHPRMIEDDLDAIVSELEQNLSKQNFTLDSYCEMTNSDIETLRNGFRDHALKRIQTRLVLEAIMELEQIEVSKEEIEAVYKDYARDYNMDIVYIRQYIDEDTIRYELSSKKTMELILNSIE